MKFEPRHAIVTGADSGIGRATAVAMAAAGMDIGITWHEDEAGARATAEEVWQLGRRTAAARLWLTDPASCGDTVDALASDLGGVDVFDSNAGTGRRLG